MQSISLTEELKLSINYDYFSDLSIESLIDFNLLQSLYQATDLHRMLARSIDLVLLDEIL